MAYRLILYIFLANVGFMMFSLARRGFRAFSGYIAQLGVLAAFMVFLLGRDLVALWSVAAAGAGIFLLVGVPMLIQRRIEALVAEQRFDEIAPLARWKARVVWSDLNAHLLDVAEALAGIGERPDEAIAQLKALMPRGEPFDATTRVFIGITLFHLRRFETLLEILLVPGGAWSAYPFEELIYIVRALLETGRHEEAMEAQVALERLVPGLTPDQRSNVVVCRMIFFAMMGWQPEFEAMIEGNQAVVDSLPPALRLYWRGIASCYAGNAARGRELLESALREAREQLPDTWIPWMRQRIMGLIEQETFFTSSLVPKLVEIRAARRDGFTAMTEKSSRAAQPPEMVERATGQMMKLLFGVFLLYIAVADQSDLLDLVRYGANSGFLVRQGEWFRLVTYQFMHMGWLHLCMNLLALKYFGPPVETLVGWPLFLGVYLVGGICGGVATAWAQNGLSVGASAAVLGLLGAAISLELFGGARAKALSRQGQISTLVFILLVNLAIGFVEKGIDNHAHLGGLAGGALAGILLARLIEHPGLVRAASVTSLIFVVSTLGLSAAQFRAYLGSDGYPGRTPPMQATRIASSSIALDLPAGWSVEPGGSPQPGWEAMAVTGPFHERFDILTGPGGDPPDEVVEAYVEHRTKALMESPGIQFESRRGPIGKSFGPIPARMLAWRLRAEDRILSQVDWFVFPGDRFVLAQCLLPTGREEVYQPLLERIMGSVRIASEPSR
ncbi:MAG TPA: rhomboid family intramembrane serine protease [Candidatus Ozemobacteraceae bacterium]|nr:rhomboid family intramembrane serine protease [Candidatus Ozemobacteraceae bacterium]